MKHLSPIVIVAVLLCAGIAEAQTTIFDENFDGGYTGVFGTSQYSGGSPINATNQVLASGGNPKGCWQETMTPTTSGDYYAGEVQLETVSGNTDTNLADYVLSFDANGSQAANIQVGIQTWPNNDFGGSGPVINATVNDQLTAANTWQTFSMNLGTVTTASPTGATWQVAFQINADQWGGVGPVDTLTIDNITLTHLTSSLLLTSSANPSLAGQGVTFTATVQTNASYTTPAGNATGTIVFSYNGVALSTQAVSGGIAVSSIITNLPVGSDVITATYSGGNYPPGSTSTFHQFVNPPAMGAASANLPIYTDHMVNGFQCNEDTAILQNLSPVYSGAYSIVGGDYTLDFMQFVFNSSPYASLSFWVNGGTNGGQLIQVGGYLGIQAGEYLEAESQGAYTIASPLPANTWEQITVPLSSLGVANMTNVAGFYIQGEPGSSLSTFYVDDVQLVAAPTPAVVHLGANAGQTLEPVDARQFGINTATWDGSLGASQTLPLLQQMGISALRWPGGSTSDNYHWENDPSGNATFRNVAKSLGAQVFTTVNYGSGTAAEAAAWVLSANMTNNCGFKYWEVGNECYGTWETDDHAIKWDPYTYATNAAAYIQQMKAAYPSVPIKVGVVVVPGENGYANNPDDIVVNPVTGVSHSGWTPVVLSTLNRLGVTPDFLIYHCYPEYTSPGQSYYADSADSDPLLLQVAGNPSPLTWSDWASAAANLRQQLTDYMGPAGSNVELCVTENNSDAGGLGRQLTSLVNALYLADSTCQLMKTEFRSYLWWDLHNDQGNNGDFDPTIYGWRTYGDEGILSTANSPYPTFYAEDLLQSFARGGDSVIASSSDNLLLSAYAVRRADGELTMLVINKDMVTNLVGQITLTNFVPWSTATIQSYGIPQDDAAETNGPAASQILVTNTYTSAAADFSYNFPPMSLTLFTFAPESALLSIQLTQPKQITLVLQGQSGVPYIVQRSPNLLNWTPITTNTLIGTSTHITLTISPRSPGQFYRVIWQP